MTSSFLFFFRLAAEASSRPLSRSASPRSRRFEEALPLATADAKPDARSSVRSDGAWAASVAPTSSSAS
uniref:Putative secreted protein n=1 Tax=Ixodes ricinus TaxID=34613 RepID=A0A6B0TR06_IXORI